MLAKRFFYVCAGMLMLTLAYHLGAVSGHAQIGMVVLSFVGVVFSSSVTPGQVPFRLPQEVM